MPYAIQKAKGTNKYFVINRNTGHKFSNSPIPRERAERQLKAIYANTHGLGGGIEKSFSGGAKKKIRLSSWITNFFNNIKF
jgi:hypothetical protein